jgi:hypothetical protein
MIGNNVDGDLRFPRLAQSCSPVGGSEEELNRRVNLLVRIIT